MITAFASPSGLPAYRVFCKAVWTAIEAWAKARWFITVGDDLQ